MNFKLLSHMPCESVLNSNCNFSVFAWTNPRLRLREGSGDNLI